MSTKAWYGVDLDGTLAFYSGWKGIEHIGEPIPEMLLRVKEWLAIGRTVKIFTARVCVNPQREPVVAWAARRVIEDWCLKHIGRVLEVTNVEDFGMIELWDDRAVQVEKNTGRLVGE